MARSTPTKRHSAKGARRPADNNGMGNHKKNHERYMTLARTAEAAGDIADIENLYQHAEHYFRLMRARSVPELAV